MGFDSPFVQAIADRRSYHFYLLTDDSIPFIQDGIRDGKKIRHKMHQWFIERLIASKRNFVVISGTPEERLNRSIKLINAIVTSKSL